MTAFQPEVAAFHENTIVTWQDNWQIKIIQSWKFGRLFSKACHFKEKNW